MGDEILQNLWTKLKEPFFRHWAQQVVQDAANYPFVLVQTLIHIGHEPLPPFPGPEFRSLLIDNIQTNHFRLQSAYSYLRYIKSVDGFSGCYRGFFPYICAHSVQYTASYWVLKLFRREHVTGRRGHSNIEEALRFVLSIANGQEPSDPDNYEYDRGDSSVDEMNEVDTEVEEKMFLLRETWWKLLSNNLGVVCSQPFYVIAVRCMAQFVGRETKYSTIFGSITEIFRNEGFSGFFKGLAPRLIAETNYIIVSSLIIFLVKKAFNESALIHGYGHLWLKTLAEYLANLIGSEYANPHAVVAHTMIVNNSGLAIGNMPHTRIYDSWTEALDILTESGQIIRGSARREYKGPFTFMNGQLRPNFYFGPLHPHDMQSIAAKAK